MASQGLRPHPGAEEPWHQEAHPQAATSHAAAALTESHRTERDGSRCPPSTPPPMPRASPASPAPAAPAAGKRGAGKGGVGKGGASSGVAWSGAVQFITISLVILASYNVSFLIESTTAILFGFRSLQTVLTKDDRGDLIRSAAADVKKVQGEAYATLASFTPPDLPSWSGPNAPRPQSEVPVVFYHGRPGEAPCYKGHFVHTAVTQAQKHNRLVHFIGPRECRQHFFSLGVAFEEYAEYEEVYEWFLRNIGTPVYVHVRWFILKAFMERHRYTRILHSTAEVLLFANITEAAAWMYPSSHMVLPVRWPSLRPPLRPHQYASIAVSTHLALMSYAGLADWCLFLLSVFRLALFGGDRDTENLVLMPAYNDLVIMGWYTFPECWQGHPVPACLGEPDKAITPELGSLLVRHGVKPRFRVHSLCQPRVCHNSGWSDEGACAFDNNFSILSKTRYFHYPNGSKCPTSTKYAFYHAWVGEPQKKPLQFLGVHFHGREKDYLTDKYPQPWETTWGSARQ